MALDVALLVNAVVMLRKGSRLDVFEEVEKRRESDEDEDDDAFLFFCVLCWLFSMKSLLLMSHPDIVLQYWK
jgi:hypothetical protein